MAMMSLVGRRSRSVLGDPRALFAPAEPYRPGALAVCARTVDAGRAAGGDRRRGCACRRSAPRCVARAPTAVRARLLESMRRRGFFNLELHGIDFIGAEEDGIPAELVARQPDLRVSLVQKRRALEATLDRLAQDYRFLPLGEVAAEVQRDGAVA